MKASGESPGKSVVYRETRIGASELSWLQALADERPQRTVQDLADCACHRFQWRRPNGEPPIGSCAVFLRRLEKWGLLSLARGRRLRNRRHYDEDLAEFLAALGPVPGMVECQPEGPLTVRPIFPEELVGFRLHLDRYHYLGFVKASGESLCYAALLGAELVALLVWGAAVPHCAPRDRYIGWDSSTRVRKLPWVVNNRRFLVLPWIRIPHLASRVLGANLRRLSRDWQAVYGHDVLLAETFVDSTRFAGTCYRASNWLHLGHTRGFSRAQGLRVGFVANQAPKAVFVYPLHRSALGRLREPDSCAQEPDAS